MVTFDCHLDYILNYLIQKMKGTLVRNYFVYFEVGRSISNPDLEVGRLNPDKYTK